MAFRLGTPVLAQAPKTPAPAVSARTGTASGAGPQIGRPAPAFTLRDAHNQRRTLAAYRGRPVTLFFSCGCLWCTQFAQAWAIKQRTGLLAAGAPHGAKPPLTLLIFTGDAQSALSFVRETGLDPAQTVVLPDITGQVTQAYHADTCPRLFVLDKSGTLRYTNDHPDDTARQATGPAIATRTLDALLALGRPQKP